MLKYGYLVIALLLWSACTLNQKKDRGTLIDQVYDLHQTERRYTNDSSFVFLDKALVLIRTINDAPDSLLIENTYRRGYVYLRALNKSDSALKYLQQTIDLITPEDGRKRNETYFRDAWDGYWEAGKYKNSAAIAQRYLDKPAKAQTDVGLYFAYNALQRVSLELQQPDEALLYSQKALEYAIKSKARDEYENQLLAKAGILFFHQQNQELEALKVLEELREREDQLHPDLKRKLYLNLGFLETWAQDHRGAIEAFEQAAAVTRETNHPYYFNEDIAECFANMSDSYRDLKQYQTAIQYLDSTQYYASKTSRTDIINYAAKNRFEIAYLRGEHVDSVSNMFQSLIESQNNLYTDRIKEDLASLRALNEKEKELLSQNQQIVLDNLNLSRQRTILFASVIIALLSIAIIALFYYQRKLRFDKRGLQMQQRLLRSQMNPHFTYNTLYTIQSLIDENPEKAGNYLVKFSRLLRLVLENSTMDYVELEKELESVEKYLQLQLLRFSERFVYDIQLVNIDDDDLLFIPPMLIQPFIENSIEHGFQGIDYPGEIKVTLTRSGKYLSCTICDNGRGLAAGQNGNKQSLSAALIADFIEKATKQKITIKDRSQVTESTSGVEVSLLIPYKFSEYD